MGLALLWSAVALAQGDPDDFGPKPAGGEEARQQYESNMAAFKDDPDKLVLPGLLADREARRVEVLAEGTGLQAIKDAVRLGRALHLLQTTALPIGVIAGRCGYSSQSRFAARFKARFGLTPSALRKTHATG